jgi:hypothetical protein
MAHSEHGGRPPSELPTHSQFESELEFSKFGPVRGDGIIQVQFGSSTLGCEPDWEPTQARIVGSLLELKFTVGGRTSYERYASLFGAKSSVPKSGRAGHPHCLRLDLKTENTNGETKLVMSMKVRGREVSSIRPTIGRAARTGTSSLPWLHQPLSFRKRITLYRAQRVVFSLHIARA